MAITLLSKTNNSKKTINRKSYPAKSISETVINGFFEIDSQWKVKHWNKAAEKLLGKQAGDIIGKNLWDEFAGVIPLNFYAVYHKAFLQDAPVHFEEYWGEMGAWYDVILYHYDDNVSVSFKISNKSVYPDHPQNPEQQLQVINELYRFVTEVTNDCLWEWNLQTRELFWIDGGHRRVFGYPIENALIPQPFWETLVHPDDRGRILTKLNALILSRSGDNWEEEFRFKKLNGEYAWVHDRGHIICEENKPWRMIGATHDITARKAAETQLITSENQLIQERLTKQKAVNMAILTAQENERADIGKELHENLNQILGATKLYIELAKTDEGHRQICLEKSSSYLVAVMVEIRKISKALASPIMIMGLVDSINILIDDMSLLHPLRFDFREIGIDEGRLDEKLQLTIFRIVQEQMNNILKHSQASRAAIHLSGQAHNIALTISDNGNGCNMLKENKGIGIINIKSRVESYYGSLAIESRPGEGYILKVVLPLE
jgi:PAS domain S-box-containing protein